VARDDLPALEECLTSGMLQSEGLAVGFRHELARSVIEDSLSPWRGAARRWAELGCPYEAALALTDSGDEVQMREGLAQLRQLGAWPAAAASLASSASAACWTSAWDHGQPPGGTQPG
jgi:hypothetical protein